MKCPRCGDRNFAWGAAFFCNECDSDPELGRWRDTDWLMEPCGVLMLREDGEIMGAAMTRELAIAMADSWEDIERCRHCGELVDVFEFMPCERQVVYYGLDGSEPVQEQDVITWDESRGCYALLTHAHCIVCRDDLDRSCEACRGFGVEPEGHGPIEVHPALAERLRQDGDDAEEATA